MKFTVQAESINLLKNTLTSECEGIRFGSEFCEWKIPNLEALKKAYEKVMDAGKTFTYVTPIVSNDGIDKLSKQLAYLRELKDVEVIIGDIGVLNLLQDYKSLQLRLGRPRVYIPARSPWSQITRLPNPSFFNRRKVEKIFYQTSLNYVRSLDYYKSLGVKGADVDWIPKCFSHYRKIVKNGFNLAIHAYAFPVAVTMRCHTARFLGEEEPSLCTKPCFNKSFNITQKELKKSFVLHGNVIYRFVDSQQRDVKQLQRMGVQELIIPMGPVSKLYTTEHINDAITTLSRGV
jgi:hypothetical protein